MRKVPFNESVKIIANGTLNWIRERPIVVSFEVTDACTCYCRHCDHGGPKDEPNLMRPEDYKRYLKVLQPCVVQISGGEPLLRDDLVEIVRNIKKKGGLPYTILVSSWSLMTVEKYQELYEAGVDQFSVSMDFPDCRHDDFRGLDGLYERLEQVVPAAAKLGYDNIVLNSCITSVNVSEINNMADKAREWGVNICYSAYSARRVGNQDLFLNTPDQLKLLNEGFDKVEARRDGTNWVVNSTSTLNGTRQYFENGGMPGCSAGRRFLVVTCRGELQPCSMHFVRYGLHEQKRMIQEFTNHNTCDECYVSIRSYLDKNFGQLLKENVGEYFSFRKDREEAVKIHS